MPAHEQTAAFRGWIKPKRRILLWIFEAAVALPLLATQFCLVIFEGVVAGEMTPLVSGYVVVPFFLTCIRLVIGCRTREGMALTQCSEHFLDCLAPALSAWYMLSGAVMIMSGFAQLITETSVGHLFIASPCILCVLNTVLLYERLENGSGFGPHMVNPAPKKKGPEPAGLEAIQVVTSFGDLPDLTQAVSTCLVCLDDFEWEDSSAKLVCGHVFHEKCIKPWLLSRSFCPLRCELRQSVRGGEAPPTAEAPQPEGSVPAMLVTDMTAPPQVEDEPDLESEPVSPREAPSESPVFDGEAISPGQVLTARTSHDNAEALLHEADLEQAWV